jgi:hypothetical protein
MELGFLSQFFLLLLLRIELYGSIIDDLRVGRSCFCSLLQVASPCDEKRLIRPYAIATRTIRKLIAVRIIIAVPCDLIDVEVFRIGIVGEVLLSSSIEI